MKAYRHGDVPITSTSKITGKKIKHNGSHILAEGETTGHHHVITTPNLDDMDIYDAGNGLWTLVLRAQGTLTHPEHKTLSIPAGTYSVGREQELDWFSLKTRRVLD